jgi:hypothetical protein
MVDPYALNSVNINAKSAFQLKTRVIAQIVVKFYGFDGVDATSIFLSRELA